MFGSLISGTIGLVADVVSPVTKLVGIDKSTILSFAALGLTVYEISEMTGFAVDVIEAILEGE